jgi:DNA-directed RNA polymerase specialized sigma subunit
MDGYEELANKIILQAVKDYRHTKSQATRRSIERFFRSDWFKVLTSIDGEELIERLREERKENERKRISISSDMAQSENKQQAGTSDVIETINQVDDPIYQLILERRYIEGKTWEEIAAGLGYDRSTVWRNHGKALKEIFKILNNATKCN